MTTALFCLACRGQFYAPDTECRQCELPLVDPGACNVLYRDQLARASLVLQRRAHMLIRETEPQRILRPEPPPGWSLWSELAGLIAPLMSNLRQLRIALIPAREE